MFAQRSVFARLTSVVVCVLRFDQSGSTVRVVRVLMLTGPVCVLSGKVFNVNYVTKSGNKSVVYKVTVDCDSKGSATLLRLL